MSARARTHWLWQRFTALPLLPLTFYFLLQMDHLTAGSRAGFVGWLREPLPASCMALFVLCAFSHACLGMEEIFLDYLPENMHRPAVLLTRLSFIALGAAALAALVLIRCGRP